MADKTPKPAKPEKPAPGFSFSTFLWGTALGAAVYYGYTKRARIVELERQLAATASSIVTAVTPATSTTPPVTTTTTTPAPLPKTTSVTLSVANARAAGSPYQVGDTVAVTVAAQTSNGAPAEFRVTARKPNGETVQSGWSSAPGGSFVLEAPAGAPGTGTWQVSADARLPVGPGVDSTIVTSAPTPLEVVLAPSTGAAGRAAFGYRR